jgi:hypothetical protein
MSVTDWCFPHWIMPARRFRPPWTVEDIGAAFVVRDHGGQALAYVYFEEAEAEEDWGR